MVRAALLLFALIGAILVIAAACDGTDDVVITVEGVSEGQESTRPLTITYSASDGTDSNPNVSAELNGEAFASGGMVVDVGEYVLVVTAEATSGEQAGKTISFKIVPPLPGVDVVLTEWSITGEEGESLEALPSGQLLLKVHNDGTTVHQFAIWKGGQVEGDRVEGGTLVAMTEFIQPGDVAMLQADLEPADHVLICPIPGHTALGMHTEAAVSRP